MWQGVGLLTGVGAFDKGWGHLPGVKMSNTLTMDEVHRNFNLTQ